MRTVKKNKGLTQILGLFLTVAMPLSFLTVPVPSAIAAEKDSLSPLEKQISGIIAKQKENPEKSGVSVVPELITLDVTEDSPVPSKKENYFKLGAAQHALNDALVKRQEPDFLNRLLAELAKNDPSSQPSIAMTVGTKIYDCYYATVDSIANNNDTLEFISPSLALNLEVAKRLHNVMTVSLAYQNLLKIELNKQALEQKEVGKTCQKEYEALQTDLDLEKARITQEYENKKLHIEQTIALAEESRKSIGNDKHNLSMVNKTISERKAELEQIKEDFEAEIIARDKQLTDKRTEHEQKIKDLKAKGKKYIDSMKGDLSYFFQGLGTTYGKKSLFRWISGRSVNRTDFDYSKFDSMLLQNKSALEEGKQLLYLKILKASTDHTGKYTVFTKDDVVSSLFNFLGITKEDHRNFGCKLKGENKLLIQMEVLKPNSLKGEQDAYPEQSNAQTNAMESLTTMVTKGMKPSVENTKQSTPIVTIKGINDQTNETVLGATRAFLPRLMMVGHLQLFPFFLIPAGVLVYTMQEGKLLDNEFESLPRMPIKIIGSNGKELEIAQDTQ